MRECRPISVSVTSSGCSWSLMSRRYTVSPVLITVSTSAPGGSASPGRSTSSCLCPAVAITRM